MGAELQRTRITAGFFRARQFITEDWHWNTFLQEVRGKDSAQMPVHFTERYLFYSLGGSDLASPTVAVFARASRGGRTNAECVLFGGGIRADGSIAKEVAVNTVKQYEGGIKWNGDNAGGFATLFRATNKVTNQDIASTTARFVSRTCEAQGIEPESAFAAGPFEVHTGVTHTRAWIASDQITPDQVGQQIIPRFVARLAPSYRRGLLKLGLNLIGTSAFPSTRGGLAHPGLVQVNVFASQALDKHWTSSAKGNNIFNRIGFTEITNSVRSIDVRTILVPLVRAL